MEKLFLRRIGNYKIRPCESSDIRDIIAVNWATLPEHYSDFFFEEIRREYPEAFLVAEGPSSVVGYIMCRFEHGLSVMKTFSFAKKGHIVSVAVLEGHRNIGLGRGLVEEALEAMRRKGCSEAYLEVRVSNKEAVSLYEKLGFRIASTIPGYYKDGEAAYLMTTSLHA